MLKMLKVLGKIRAYNPQSFQKRLTFQIFLTYPGFKHFWGKLFVKVLTFLTVPSF